ncbi:MAG TPA: (2Fe-2S)-binding protein [Anaeromyxobacteraceae bacterium]|nr:(2Fe-2S)-binding protein [Anaeromyxobacteraceae bacterium]
MIVCSCHAVSDRALRDAVTAGLSHAQIVATSGAGTDCGHCRDDVAEIVTGSRDDHGCGNGCPGCPCRSAAA